MYHSSSLPTSVNGKLDKNIGSSGIDINNKVDISKYTIEATNSFELPKSGIVVVQSNTSNTNIKAGIGIVGIGNIKITSYPFKSSIYLPKGTKVYNMAYEGNNVSQYPASYSSLWFYPNA